MHNAMALPSRGPFRRPRPFPSSSCRRFRPRRPRRVGPRALMPRGGVPAVAPEASPDGLSFHPAGPDPRMDETWVSFQ